MTTILTHHATNKEISKKIMRLAVPMALTQFMVIASSFLCMMMLAKLGHEVLAASALISSLNIAITVISMSLLFSLSVLVSHKYGTKDYLAIKNFLHQGWLIALIISIVTMLILWNIYPILIFFHQDPTLARIVEEFFHISLWRILPLLLSVCNQQICYGIHKQKIDLIANIIGVSILLISSYIFIFGKFGCPALGVVGFGYAIILQSLGYFTFIMGCFYYLDDFKPFHLFDICLKQNWHQLKYLLKIGVPISLQISAEVLALAVSATFMGWLGVNTLAAYQITLQYQFLVVTPIFAISQACGVLVGQAYSSQQFTEVKLLSSGSIRITVILMSSIGLIFILFPKALASLYLNLSDPANNQTIHLTVILFAAIAISQLFDGIKNILMGSLRGLLDTKFSMLIGILSIWVVGMPLSYWFAFSLQWGAIGVIIGWTVGMALGAVMLHHRWKVKTS